MKILHHGQFRCHSDMCSPVLCVPPEHLSLVICVSPVGKHKTLTLCIQTSKWFQSDQTQNAIFCVSESAYHLYGKPGNSGENSNGTVLSGGMFSEKRSYLSRYSFFSLFPEFPEISVPFVHNYQCQAISERTAMPMTAD